MINIYLAVKDTDNENDKELIISLYNKYSKKVYYTAYNILKRKTDSEDAVSETYYKIIKYISKFRNIDEDETARLIFIYARSACFNIYNKLSREKTISVNDMIPDPEGADGGLDLDVPDNIDLLEELIKDETIERVKESVYKLDAQVQDIIKMKYRFNMKNTENADILGIGESAVGVILLRARTKLKKMLEEYINGKTD